MKQRITVTVERIRRIVVRQSRSPTGWPEPIFEEGGGAESEAPLTTIIPRITRILPATTDIENTNTKGDSQ